MAGGMASVLVAGAALNFWNPVGWVAGALAILGAFFSWIAGLFKSKQKKIADLNKQLEQSLEKACSSLADQITNYCENGVAATVEKPAEPGPFEIIRKQLHEAEDKQNKMLDICEKFLDLNNGLLSKADEYSKKLAAQEKQLRGGTGKTQEALAVGKV